MEMMVRKKFDINNRRVSLPSWFLERIGKKDAKQVIFTVEGRHIYIQPLNRMEIIKMDKEFAIREIFNTEKFDRRVQIPKELFDELNIKECKQILLTIPDKKHISVTFIRLNPDKKPEKPKKDGRRNLTERNILDMFNEPEEEPEPEESKYTTPEQWASMVIHDRIHNVKFNPYEYRWHSTDYEYMKRYFTANVNGRVVSVVPQDARNGGEILWKRLSIQEKKSLGELKEYIQSYIDSRPDNSDLEEDKKFITFLTLLIAKGIITKSDDSTLRQRYEKYRNFMLSRYKLDFNFNYKYRLEENASNF